MLHDDLLAPEASADPHGVLAQLREHDPVHWSEAHKAWLLTGYDDVSAAFQNKALSSDRIRPLLARRRDHGPASDAERTLQVMQSWMVVSDPPAHTRLRRLVAQAFKGQRIAAMSEGITQLVDRLIDDVLAGPHRPHDLISEVAYPLPATVIATMLGAPVEDRGHFREWSDELGLVAFGAGGAARAERHERALRGLREMNTYLRELIALRRREPGEDMLTAMMARDPNNPGDRLSDDELVGMCSLLLFAGHETTTNSIANGVFTLLRHPGQLALLRERPELLGNAVEELLRFDGPIKVLNRWVIQDAEIGGRPIKTGERVHIVLAGANRDPRRFADPNRLDVTRAPNPHVAFGKGIHACVGAQLARIETRIAIDRIVSRLPGMRLSEAPTWHSSLASRAMNTLMVEFDAARATRPVGA